MSDIEPDWVSAAGTVFSAFAAIGAAVAAFLAYRLQRSIAKSRQQFIKREVLLEKIQLLIVAFADVRATSKEISSPKGRRGSSHFLEICDTPRQSSSHCTPI